MARGNLVDSKRIGWRFGYWIIGSHFKWQSFKRYDKIKISKKGTVIGYWRAFATNPYYKDFLDTNCQDFEIVRIYDERIYLKRKAIC